MMLANVRFNVLLLKFCISMPGLHVTSCPTFTAVCGMATHVFFPLFPWISQNTASFFLSKRQENV